MKTIVMALYGLGLCAGVAAGVWLSADEPAAAAGNAAQQPMTSANAPVDAQRTAPVDHASKLWAWGNADAGKTGAGKASASKTNKSLDILLAQAMRASSSSVEGNDPREKLRRLAQEDPAVMAQLMQSYDKEPNSQIRDLIVSLLSGIEKPEVLAFSKRLASSSDMAQRQNGFIMLQNLSGDVPEVRPVILQALSADKSPETLMLALGALKPPAGAGNNTAQANDQAADAAAIVAQLQKLSRNADPEIRLQSLLQLAQWDKAGSSQEQWAQALADQSPQVRQAAVTAIAESGSQSDAVKAALLSMANNPGESKDVRGNALQVLERFSLSQDEAANFSQLRSQVLGL